MSARVPSSKPRASSRANAVAGGAVYTCWAVSEADLRAAQRLRQRIFFEESGFGDAAAAPIGEEALDTDHFDGFCDHLLVKVAGSSGADGDEVIATYRVLPPDAARRAGGYYTDTEFELRSFESLRGGAVELGRSCVHRDWRRGGVIMMLWTELGSYMRRRGLASVIGCCSVGLLDQGDAARAIWRELSLTHLVAEADRSRPRIPFDVGEDPMHALGHCDHMPALMKGYLRCGARLLGAPAYDKAFNTADFPMLLRLNELSPSYRRHFLREAA